MLPSQEAVAGNDCQPCYEDLEQEKGGGEFMTIAKIHLATPKGCVGAGGGER